MTDTETAHQIRGIVARAVVRASNDEAESQTATVIVYKGVDRSDVEILTPYGFASRAPKGGPVIVLAVGGDQGDLVALPVGQPAFRLGFMEEGDAAIHTVDGSRVMVKKDGSIECISSKRVISKVEEVEIEATKDMARGRVGQDGGRFVARPNYAKIRAGNHFLVATTNGLVRSGDIPIGPDPEPGV